jgi:hypothetical protein
MFRREAVHAEVFETHRQILRRGRGIVGEEEKGCAGTEECLDEITRAGNEIVLR